MVVKCHFSKNLVLCRGNWGCYNAGMRVLLMLLTLVVPAMAQEQNRPAYWGAGGRMPQRPAKPAHWGAAGKMPERKDARPDAHQRMLEKYDTNKDGKLDEAERKAMRK